MLPLTEFPGFQLVCEKSNFSHRKTKHKEQIKKHYFNFRVQLFIPECGRLPNEMSNLPSELPPYYIVNGLPLTVLLQEDFIENFVRQGSVYALSYDTRIDQDDSFSLLPTGSLLLSLQKDTYETLGLQGKPSVYAGRKPLRYVVNIDLTSPTFKAGKNNYERAIWALGENLSLKFNVLMAGKGSGETDHSLAEFLTPFGGRPVLPEFLTQTVLPQSCPTLHSNQLSGQDMVGCGAIELFDWLGAVTAGISCSNPPDGYPSSLGCPEPNEHIEQGFLLNLTGLITPETVIELLQRVRNFFSEPKFATWAALTVHGFADVPVAWGTGEHGFHKGGENLYTFVVFVDGSYWLLRATGTQDVCL
uniref:ribonuclease P protein subunit p40 isoform X1 n=1 Tax=Myxine glutinosa TaxID=7769 RepID=UPI00358E266E